MEVVIIMKKGYSLVEILVSLVLLASLLVCVGSIFISGLKYKTRASDYYDVFNNVDQALGSFERLQQEYQHRMLSKSGAYLKADDLVIMHYENKVLTFYFIDQITTTISDVDLLDFNVGNHLLMVSLQSGQQIIRRYYYFGGLG